MKGGRDDEHPICIQSARSTPIEPRTTSPRQGSDCLGANLRPNSSPINEEA